MSDQLPRLPDFIICGLEHSGTTLVSDLFREHPDCDSGFECGVLLCRSPLEFPSLNPFYSNMAEGWGLSKEELCQACSSDSFGHFYSSVFQHSRLLRQKKDSPFGQVIFDKTPRYITDIERICAITEKPVIALIRDPRSLAASDFKRSRLQLTSINQWYDDWMPKKREYMRKAYEGYLHAWTSNQCIVVRHEDLCTNTLSEFKRIFRHVGLIPHISFLKLRSKRFKNSKGVSIEVGACIDFIEVLTPDIEARIIEDFKEFNRWFFDFHGALGENRSGETPNKILALIS